VGWGKVACWSTKAAISLKRVQIDEKLLRRAYRNSPMLFRTVPSRPPTASLSPRLEISNPNPQLQSLLSQERVKLRTANLADTFTGSIRTKVHEKFGRKKERRRIQTVQIFLVSPSQERVKLRTSNFVRTFTGWIGTKTR